MSDRAREKCGELFNAVVPMHCVNPKGHPLGGHHFESVEAGAAPSLDTGQRDIGGGTAERACWIGVAEAVMRHLPDIPCLLAELERLRGERDRLLQADVKRAQDISRLTEERDRLQAKLRGQAMDLA